MAICKNQGKFPKWHSLFDWPDSATPTQIDPANVGENGKLNPGSLRGGTSLADKSLIPAHDRSVISVAFPSDYIVDTSYDQADRLIQRLSDRKQAWTTVSLSDRMAYLQQCVGAVEQVAEDWVTAACQAKGIDPQSNLAGEEWLTGPATLLSNLQGLIQTLQAQGQPRPAQLRQAQGQTIARVFPDNWRERLLWLGYRGEIWLEPGQPASQGQIYRQSPPRMGRVTLVLGAGNVAAIAPMDALYQLLVENAVVLLKMNPVNAYLGAFLEPALRPLQEAGWLAIVYGGPELGRYLCQHEQIDQIHMTGSHHTHDAIVWGADPAEQSRRKATHQPRNCKPITSELGCVAPVIVVPGHWSKADLRYQARQVAGMVVQNASFNCAAAQVLVTAKSWPQRSTFLTYVQQELAATAPRLPYYPGAIDRYQAFLERYPTALPLGDGCLPWTVIPDVPNQPGEYALTQEAFCGLLADVSLEAATAAEFLSQAVSTVNAHLWGNLSCTVLIDPATHKRYSSQVEQAIADLRYGTIGINVWSAVIFSLPSLPWGAFPGNPLEDIASGRGWVHNTYLFDHPQKAVLRAPFRVFPLPSWFARHGNLRSLAQRFTKFQARPSWGRLWPVIAAAIRG